MPRSDTCYAIMLNQIDGRSTTPDIIARHIAHLRELDDAGTLVLAGPFEDYPGGMVIIRADSLDAAKQIAASDPFVSEGVRTFEVRTWLLATKENGYLG